MASFLIAHRPDTSSISISDLLCNLLTDFLISGIGGQVHIKLVLLFTCLVFSWPAMAMTWQECDTMLKQYDVARELLVHYLNNNESKDRMGGIRPERQFAVYTPKNELIKYQESTGVFFTEKYSLDYPNQVIFTQNANQKNIGY